jgi:hypothetical protein
MEEVLYAVKIENLQIYTGNQPYPWQKAQIGGGFAQGNKKPPIALTGGLNTIPVTKNISLDLV